MSGYEIITIAKEWRFNHYIKAASNASFYYTLNILEKNGLIKKVGSKQKENRPEQTIFQLLPKGREVFVEHMDHFLGETQHFYFDIDVTTPFILLFGFYKGKEFILNAIKKQIQKSEKIFDKIEDGSNYVKSHPMFELNPFLILSLEHYKFHNQAEIKWLKEFYKMIEDTDFKKNIQEIAKKNA